MNKINYLSVAFALATPAGYIYNFDWPQALSTPLQQKPYEYSLQQIHLLYSISQSFAVLLCFKIGMLMDTMKPKHILILIPLLTFISQFGIATSFLFAFTGNYYLIMFFRSVFATLGECTFILQAMVLKLILKQKSIYFLGFGEVIAGTFESFNSLITPLLYDRYKLAYVPLYTGAAVCLIPMLGCLYIIFQLKQQKSTESKEQNEIISATNTPSITTQPISFMQQIKQFDIAFWMLQLLIFLTYIMTNVFVSGATDLIVKRFNIEYTLAGQIVMIPFLTCALFSVLIMKLIQWHPTQRRLLFLIGTTLGFLGESYIQFLPNTTTPTAFYYASIVIIFLMVGFLTSILMMTIFPAIYLVSKQEQTGAAFGVSAVGTSLAYVVAPIIYSFVADSFEKQQVGYVYGGYVFVGFGALSVLLTLVMRCSDRFTVFDRNVQTVLSQEHIGEPLLNDKRESKTSVITQG